MGGEPSWSLSSGTLGEEEPRKAGSPGELRAVGRDAGITLMQEGCRDGCCDAGGRSSCRKLEERAG